MNSSRLFTCGGFGVNVSMIVFLVNKVLSSLADKCTQSLSTFLFCKGTGTTKLGRWKKYCTPFFLFHILKKSCKHCNSILCSVFVIMIIRCITYSHDKLTWGLNFFKTHYWTLLCSSISFLLRNHQFYFRVKSWLKSCFQKWAEKKF